MSLFGKPGESKQPSTPAVRHPSTAAVATSSVSPARSASPTSACVIGSKTTVKGDLMGDEDIVIDGNVE
jgi:cytoskeletal protein CcmA (bactofilin family)